MITTIVFDLGKVLVDFHPEEGMRRLGFSKQAIEAFNQNIFSGLWEKCDERPISDADIRELFKTAVCGFEKEVDVLWDNIHALTGVYDYSYQWIKNLKDRGYKVYILSNFGQRAFEINSELYTFLELVDGKVISYQIGKTKPDAAIYNYLFDTFGIIPEEAVFIDDRPVNIDGAVACGMHGIVFESYSQAGVELEEMLK